VRRGVRLGSLLLLARQAGGCGVGVVDLEMVLNRCVFRVLHMLFRGLLLAGMFTNLRFILSGPERLVARLSMR